VMKMISRLVYHADLGRGVEVVVTALEKSRP
jgi:hypothetical protein